MVLNFQLKIASFGEYRKGAVEVYLYHNFFLQRREAENHTYKLQ